MGVLFISHSSQDNDQAIKVRDWLRTNGWGEVFLDLDPAHGLAPGQRWQEELKRAGENCAAVVVLVSPNWVASRWCQTEFLVADQLGKRIFPVFIAPTSFDDLPLELKAKFQLADISTPEREEEGFQRLATGLKRAGLDPKSFDWPPANEPNRSVYRGLQALDVQDAATFFGRDAHITQGLDELRRLRDGAPKRIMVVLGASGAGKSSFLRAGLIARLRRDEENFLVLPIVRPEGAAITGPQGLNASLSAALGNSVTLSRPEDLVQAFAQARAPVVERLQRQAEAAREAHQAKPPTIVLPLDQGEELFATENAERAAFCTMLAETLATDGNALVIVTIRSDCYEPLQIEPRLAGAGQLLLNLPPIAAGSFQEIIEGPARLAKPPLTIEPALTQQLLADLNAADALPLLAFTLERLQRQFVVNGTLTLTNYHFLEGLSGVIQSAVDTVLGEGRNRDSLGPARRLFLPALVQVDQEGVRRRTASRAELPAETQDLAEKFIAQRLLVSDGGKIEVAHEAILRHWPALKEWIEEERQALGFLSALRVSAQEWRTRQIDAGYQFTGKPSSWLTHHGNRLRLAEEVAARADFASAIDDDMRAYLTACRKEERRAAGSRLRMQVLAGISALAVIGASFAFVTQNDWRPELHAWWNYKRFAQSAEELEMALPGTTFQDCREGSTDCPTMVILPPGEFLMGSPVDDPENSGDESPQRRTSIPRFAVSQNEVTFANWSACVVASGCDGYSPERAQFAGGDDWPVVFVSWDDAQKYVNWLSSTTGQQYRLLSEAEWEFAARGVTTSDTPNTRFSWGDEDPLCDRAAPNGAAFAACSEPFSLPVGSFAANNFGLHDMHGNVMEWVQDCYQPYGDRSAGAGAVEADDCAERVLRGGALFTHAHEVRSAARKWFRPAFRNINIGFRVARNL